MFSRNKQVKNIQSPFYDLFPTETINPPQKRKLKHNKNYQAQENFIKIDPWHTNSEKKQNPSARMKNIYDRTLSRRLYNNSERKYTKNQSLQTLNRQIKETPFHLIIADEGISSPTKIDMMECSFRFQQYQNRKAQQIKQKFPNEVLKNNQKLTNHIFTGECRKKNFIQRNIKNAFLIENQIQMSKMNLKTDKKKTIQQQAKQKLMSNNKKLERSSKQLQRFISMKQSIPHQKSLTQKLQKYVYKVPIESKWNFSYVEKQPNPQQKMSKKNRFHKILLKSKGKSLQTQKTKDQKSFHKNQKKNQNHMSRKLSRLYKVKNKSALVIQSQFSQNNIKRVSKCKSKQSYRIHSLTPNKTYQEIHPNGLFLQFEKDFEFSKGKNKIEILVNPKSRQNQRSFSANLIKRNISLHESKPIQKQIKTKSLYKQKPFSVTNSFYISGKQCEMSKFAHQ